MRTSATCWRQRTVVAQPSRVESLGLVLVEAWANAKPVIAADIEVSRHLVRKAEAEWLCPLETVNGWPANSRACWRTMASDWRWAGRGKGSHRIMMGVISGRAMQTNSKSGQQALMRVEARGWLRGWRELRKSGVIDRLCLGSSHLPQLAYNKSGSAAHVIYLSQWSLPASRQQVRLKVRELLPVGEAMSQPQTLEEIMQRIRAQLRAPGKGAAGAKDPAQTNNAQAAEIMARLRQKSRSQQQREGKEGTDAPAPLRLRLHETSQLRREIHTALEGTQPGRPDQPTQPRA